MKQSFVWRFYWRYYPLLQYIRIKCIMLIQTIGPLHYYFA